MHPSADGTAHHHFTEIGCYFWFSRKHANSVRMARFNTGQSYSTLLELWLHN
jgi:hypothetical protein